MEGKNHEIYHFFNENFKANKMFENYITYSVNTYISLHVFASIKHSSVKKKKKLQDFFFFKWKNYFLS